jgi:3-oxoacyl-[acyl-carrier protein] reductase
MPARHSGKFEEATLEMDRVIDINVRGVFVAMTALKHMNDGGRIIMIRSSVASMSWCPLVPYSATKGAVKIFSQALSREVGPQHHCQQRAAGPIDTI